MSAIKQFFKYMDLKDAVSGSVRIPKSQILESKDPMALRAAISEQYADLVQKHPELNFGIIVDPNDDSINVSWSRKTD
jgi:hypothetical protein